MIFDELLQNMKEIINTNNECENVIEVFNLGEKLIKNNEVRFIIEPKNTTMLKGMFFKGNEPDDVLIIIGQKYADTYKKTSSLHHTMFIHELKHLFDYYHNKDTFMKCKYKERHFLNLRLEILKLSL